MINNSEYNEQLLLLLHKEISTTEVTANLSKPDTLRLIYEQKAITLIARILLDGLEFGDPASERSFLARQVDARARLAVYFDVLQHMKENSHV